MANTQGLRFVQAANYTVANRESVDLGVIHTMEAPEKGDTAEAVAAFFARKSTRASAHECIDDNSVVLCVRKKDVAWAASGANHDGYHFEHAGYAAQTEQDWRDDFSKRMLILSAQRMAMLCRSDDIPPVFLHASDLIAQKRGITTHLEITKAFSHGIGHTDPGKHFPIEDYVRQVQRYMLLRPGDAPTAGRPVKAPLPTLKNLDTGHNVRILQRLLNFEEKRAWDDIKVDGTFGSRTVDEVKEFQRRAGLRPDGIVGPSTWAALWAARYTGN